MTVSPGPTLIDSLNKPIFLPSLMKSWSKYCWVFTRGNVSFKCNINVILIVTWWFLRSLALFLSPSTSAPAEKVTNHALFLLSFLGKIYGKIPPNSVWPSPCLCSKFRYHFQKIPIIYQNYSTPSSEGSILASKRRPPTSTENADTYAESGTARVKLAWKITSCKFLTLRT